MPFESQRICSSGIREYMYEVYAVSVDDLLTAYMIERLALTSFMVRSMSSRMRPNLASRTMTFCQDLAKIEFLKDSHHAHFITCFYMLISFEPFTLLFWRSSRVLPC
jgi:hypothetical protein